VIRRFAEAFHYTAQQLLLLSRPHFWDYGKSPLEICPLFIL
jgi:hypothetical protein